MKAWALLLVAVVAGQAGADVVQTRSRVEQLEYQDSLVVKVSGYANNPVVIELPSDEPIADATDAAELGYEVGRKGNRLIVRPLANAKQATVLVWTKSRSYVFDFSPGLPQAFNNRTSKVIITLPRPPAAVTPPATAPIVRPQPPAPAQSLLVASGDARTCARATDRAEYRNDKYSMQIVSETVDIRPREAFDNGRFTFLKFPNNVEVPTIFRSTPGSTEEVIVNSHRECDFMVLHAVSPLWTLRLGGSVIGVFNDSYEAEGVGARNGSTVPGLERLLK